jgi:hypothetical protein
MTQAGCERWESLSGSRCHGARTATSRGGRRNGFVDKRQLQAVRKYWRAVARANQKLGFAEEEM